MAKKKKKESKYVTEEQWAQVIGRAWLDHEFAAALERDPVTAIREAFPAWEFKRVFHVAPTPRTISEELLEQIADGEEEALLVSFSCLCVG
jgi:hypothetical protein